MNCDDSVKPEFSKRVRDIEMRGFNWEPLANGSALLSASWDTLHTDLTKLGEDITLYLQAIAFSGGAIGQTYDIVSKATFADGREKVAVMKCTVIPD